MALLRPIADLFNQLRRPDVLKTPMECIRVVFGQCESTSLPLFLVSRTFFFVAIYGTTFIAEDFKTHGLTAPMILSLVKDILLLHPLYSEYLIPCSNSLTICSILREKSLPASNTLSPKS